MVTNIAQLKSRLSYFLSLVRRGEEVLVLDRKTPIAKVISSGPATGPLVIEPRREAKTLRAIPVPRIRSKTDSMRVLREDRDRR